MDRNIGALDVSYSPQGSPGVIQYQFGRKDPMHTMSDPGITPKLESGPVPTSASVQNPGTFFLARTYLGWTLDHIDSTYFWHEPNTLVSANYQKSTSTACNAWHSHY